MRTLAGSWHRRLEELGKGESFSHPQAVPSVIRVGLVKASLTAAGLFALRTGFVPAGRDLALLRSLAGHDVWPRKVWRFDADGLVLEAHGSALGRFRRCRLCVRGRRGSRQGPKVVPYRATQEGLRLAYELADRFGPGWWREGSA